MLLRLRPTANDLRTQLKNTWKMSVKNSVILTKNSMTKNAVFEPCRSSPIFLFCSKNFRKHFKRKLLLTIMKTFNCERYVHFKIRNFAFILKKKNSRKRILSQNLLCYQSAALGKQGKRKSYVYHYFRWWRPLIKKFSAETKKLI